MLLHLVFRGQGRASESMLGNQQAERCEQILDKNLIFQKIDLEELTLAKFMQTLMIYPTLTGLSSTISISCSSFQSQTRDTGT